MKIALYPMTCARAGIPIMEYFKQGLLSCNEEVIEVQPPTTVDCDVPVVWSFLWDGKGKEEIFKAYRQQTKNVLIIEVGGLIRNTYWKFGINGINNEANFNNENSPPDRWNKLNQKLLPWRNTGDSIIICSQNVRSGAWPRNVTMEAYITKTIEQIREVSHRPIILRHHPRSRFNDNLILKRFSNIHTSIPMKYRQTYDDFDFPAVLEKAWAVISYNSNPGIEAAIKGTPVFCDKSSLASPVGNLDLHNIENPLKPDREQWAYDLAYCEWNEEEIKRGLPWLHLKNQIVSI